MSKPQFCVNMDMLKPMPPIRPIPMICLKFSPGGNVVKPDFTASHEKPAMPRSLPNTSPAEMPIDVGWVMVSPNEEKSMGTPVFAREKIGIMI